MTNKERHRTYKYIYVHREREREQKERVKRRRKKGWKKMFFSPLLLCLVLVCERQLWHAFGPQAESYAFNNKGFRDSGARAEGIDLSFSLCCCWCLSVYYSIYYVHFFYSLSLYAYIYFFLVRYRFPPLWYASRLPQTIIASLPDCDFCPFSIQE